jgi:hypothetical protein
MDARQTNIFETEAAIQRGVDHADRVEPGWSDTAWDFLVGFLRDTDEFMAEDVRAKASGLVPDPPDARAWGGVIRRAVKAGMLTRVGYGTKKAKNCHMQPITIWRTNR